MAKVHPVTYPKINFNRLTKLMIDTQFWVLPAPTPTENKAIHEKDGATAFHAARLFSWEEDWPSWIGKKEKHLFHGLSVETRLTESESESESEKKLDYLDLAKPAKSPQSLIDEIEEEKSLSAYFSHLKIESNKRKSKQKIELFAFKHLMKDLQFGEIDIPDLNLPADGELASESFMKELQAKARQTYKKDGVDYECPLFVYWLSLHGLNYETLIKLSQEIEGTLIESNDLVDEYGPSDESTIEEGMGSPLKIHEAMSQFSLKTQAFLWFKDFVCALSFGFDGERQDQLNEKIRKSLKELPDEFFRNHLQRMITELVAHVSVSSIPIPYETKHRDLLRTVLNSPQRGGSFHVHRRRLSETATFTHHREELLQSCPKGYSVNPLNLVLEYLNAAVRQYDESSEDYQILNQKRDIVVRYCKDVDLRRKSLAQAVEELLLEDDLYKRRNFLDCRTPKTVKLIKACKEGALAVQKLLPPSVIGKLKMGQINRALEEPYAV